MYEPMFFQVIRLLERTLAPQQLGRAKRCQSLGEQGLREKIGIAAMAQADGNVDLVALEIRKRDRRRDPQIDVWVPLIEYWQSRDQPFGGKGGRNAYRQRSRVGRRGLIAADCPCENLQSRLDVRQHSHGRIGEGNGAPRSVEQPYSEELLECADLLADGARRDVELLGGLAETEPARDGLESTQ
jgi:hypothetical protein